jgi:hypothetical protein
VTETTSAKLEEWRLSCDPMLAGLQDFVVGPDDPLDGSPESLRLVEELFLQEALPGQMPPEGFAQVVGAYLGEALLDAGGGSWVWDEVSDLPAVRLDPALGWTIEPMRVVLDAVMERSGTVCADLLAQVAAAVVEYQQDAPDWQPTRTDKSVLRQVPASAVPADPWLADWLTTRRERFAEWARACGVPDELDFSVASLDTVERLVRDRAGSVADLRQIKHDEFIQAAVWYVGETACRHGGAHWIYRTPPEGGSKNPWVGRPFVQRDPPSNADLIPFLELKAAVADDAKGIIVERFEEFLED